MNLDRPNNYLKPNNVKFLHINFKYEEGYEGEQISVYQNDVLIWGTIVENKTNIDKVSYRNIRIDSRNKFVIECNFKVKRKVTRNKQFSKKQKDYDKFHGLKYNNSVYYSSFGNERNPDKLIIAFPYSSKLASEIQYPMYIDKKLIDTTKTDTLYIALQDRYFSIGSYLTIDEYNLELKNSIEKFIDDILDEYCISKDNLILLGAYQGGASAIYYANKYIEARLILIAPVLNFIEFSRLDHSTRNVIIPSLNNKVNIDLISLLEKYNDQRRNVTYMY